VSYNKLRGRLSLPFPPEPADTLADRVRAFIRENESRIEGRFPVGASQTWHCGIHLQAREGTAVRCMAPGKVIAARVRADSSLDGNPLGSPCFVLVRHELDLAQDPVEADLPDRTKGTRRVQLYTLYMHLQRARAMPEPAPWLQSFLPFLDGTAPGSGVFARINVAEDARSGSDQPIGLNVRFAPTASGGKVTPGNLIGCIPKGTVVEYMAGRIGYWQEVRVPTEGIASGWIFARGDRIEPMPSFGAQLSALRAGKVARLDAETAAGEVIGHVGEIQPNLGARGGGSWGCHLEAFSEANLFAEVDRSDWWLVDDDTDDDAIAEFKDLTRNAASTNTALAKLLQYVGWDTSHWLTRRELEDYFARLSEDERRLIRWTIVRSTSFWAVNWANTIEQNPKWAAEYGFGDAEIRIATQYAWWKECEVLGVPLPKRTDGKALVFHYHPLSLFEYLDARWVPKRKWHLGTLSARYESSGDPGTVSTGKGDYGGVSYGSYQFATNVGVPQDFVKYLKGVHPEFHAALDGKTPGSEQFSAAWKTLATKDRGGFQAFQHEFTQTRYYDAARKLIEKQIVGLDLDGRSMVLSDVLWSTAVQHGHKAAALYFVAAFGNSGAAQKSDQDVITAVYAERGREEDGVLVHFSKCDADVQKGVKKRYSMELKDALARLAAEGKR
jgi:hypothetical protein